MSFFDMTSDADVEDDLDRVETDVVVDCDIEAAWALVSEPGWWVNDGPLGDHEVSLGDDGIYRVSDPDVGDWLIEKADEDPMDVVAFRWYPLADDELPDEYATRVEISLSEERGGVGIHVEESGLASVSDDEAVARHAGGLWAAKEAFIKAWSCALFGVSTIRWEVNIRLTGSLRSNVLTVPCRRGLQCCASSQCCSL